MKSFETLCMECDLHFQYNPATYIYIIRNDKGKCVYKYYAGKDKLHRISDNAFFYGKEVAKEIKNYHFKQQISRSTYDDIPVNPCKVAASVPGGAAVRQRFLEMMRGERLLKGDCAFQDSALIAVVKLKSGAKEIIVNHEGIEEKCNYYLTAYDENFQLKSCPDIQIVGIMLV